MIEKLYEDFTTKLLPTIQDGLVITKDYFMDLFGRYVKYLIIIDSLYLAISISCIILSIFIYNKIRKYIKKEKETNTYDCGEPYEFLYLLPIFIILAGLMGFFDYSDNLIKDLTVPEIRVYEELKDFKNN